MKQDEPVLFFLFLALAIFILGYLNYTNAFRKCEKAGKPPAFCADYLR